MCGHVITSYVALVHVLWYQMTGTLLIPRQTNVACFNKHHAVAWNWMAKHKGGLRKVSKAKGQQPAIHKRVHSERKQQVKAKAQENSCARDTALQYDEYQRILCIGEGNFSFSRALVRKLEGQGQLLTATAYDTKEIVWEKYKVSCVQRLVAAGTGAELFGASSQVLDFRTARILSVTLLKSYRDVRQLCTLL